MARELIAWAAGQPSALLVAVALDLAFGDPEYRWHPVRLIGGSLTAIEARLRAAGFDGRAGGIALFILLAALWLGALALLGTAAIAAGSWIAWAAHVAVTYSLLALGDLIHHVRRVDRAASTGGEPAAREAIAILVGRDVDRMDAAACRRAAIESLGENLTDGFTSPLAWYAVAGLPGLVIFKVVSTMDSMVGYRTPRYLYFGWCGARLDDLLNFLPARVTWLLLALAALVVPGASSRKAWQCGLRQHAVLPGPNSGWSEAATAGAIQRRLVGPIWIRGQLVTDTWIGAPGDPPAATSADVVRAIRVVTVAGLAGAAMAVAWLC